jgi:hypothetical protein
VLIGFIELVGFIEFVEFIGFIGADGLEVGGSLPNLGPYAEIG